MGDGVRTAVIVDDDPDVRLMLRVALEAIGFAVHEADTGQGGVDFVRACEPDLVTLDLVLPGFGGVEVCRRIRGITNAYIMMISASADEADRLVGLTLGADDYVTKPFSPREVQARVSAMFRRPRLVTVPASVDAVDPFTLIAPSLPAPPPAFGVRPGENSIMQNPMSQNSTSQNSMSQNAMSQNSASPGAVGRNSMTQTLPSQELPDGFRPDIGVTALVPGPRSPMDDTLVTPDAEFSVLRHGQIMVDGEARIARYGETELPLTKIEFDLLATMMGNPRRVWRRETLLNIVWGGAWSDYHVVEVHIGNLRRKLSDAAGSGILLIKTVRGIGYRMAPVEP